MSALPSMSPAESAAAYERSISENWDRLSPFEQDQARAYMQARFEGVPPQQPPQLTPTMHSHPPQMMMPANPMPSYPNPAPGYGSAAPGFPNATPGYGLSPTHGFGYGSPKQEQGGGWAVPVGYISLLLFITTPLAFGCGIYNLTKGRTGHGIAQAVISVMIFLVNVVLVASML